MLRSSMRHISSFLISPMLIMIPMSRRKSPMHRVARVAVAMAKPLTRAIAVSVTAYLAACHGLLDVTDPTLIRDQDIANASGANGRRTMAVYRFMEHVGSTTADVAYFTDELGYDINPSNLGNSDNFYLDQRDSQGYEAAHPADDPHLGNLDWTITQTSIAMPQIRLYTPENLKGDYLGQMFAYRGYNIVQMAEDICSGFPINDVTGDNVPILSGPYTTDSALTYGIAQLDSAAALVTDSTVYVTFAHVVKGRALLDLGKYNEAAAAVVDVPTGFVYLSNPNNYNTFFICPWCDWSTEGSPVGDGEGGNGLHFVSEHDARVPTVYMQQRLSDSMLPEYAQAKYTDQYAQFVIASGTEARLIEAEVALHNHDASWLTTLNALRRTAGLDSLPDPGTDSARVDLIYHERAFWMFLTGRRLGDLRRLIRNYGRTPESVFPTGPYPLVGEYRGATAIPFSFANESLYNEKITTGCTAR